MRNTIILDNLYDLNLNFRKLLNQKDSIIWKNCEKLKINVISKVNKMIFVNCKNVKIIIGDTISGLEFEKCENIDIYLIVNTKIKSLSSYKSNINLNFHSNQKENILFNLENSKINYNKLN